MKFNKIIILIKVVLIAFLISNSEARSLSRKSLSTLKRFQSNARKFNTAFVDVNLTNVKDLLFGIIGGFVTREVELISKTIEITFAAGLLTVKTLGEVFDTCLPEANKKFQENKDAANKAKNFNMFISVLPSAIAPRRINKYLENCEKKDHNKDKEFTDDHKFFLAKTLEILKKYHSQNKETTKEYEEEGELLTQLETAKNYFDYSDKSYLTYYFSSTRTICSYFDQKDDWKSIFSRWFDYGTHIAKCGAKTFVKKFFSDKQIFIPLLTEALIKGFANFIGLGVFKLVRALYNFTSSLIVGNSNYYAVGETLGREIADITPWNLPKSNKRRHRY